MFHTLNAYDDGDRVVANLVRYGGPYDASDLEGKGPLTLERWTIDPGSGQVSRQGLHDRAQEFPRVDDRIVSQPHRYGYSASIGEVSRNTVSLSGDFADGAFANALLKHDLGHGSTEAHEFGPDATAGEAVFAPASPAPGKTTATCWPSSTTPSAAPRTWCCSPRRTSPASRWRGCTCRPGSRSASTATGSPTSNGLTA